MTYLLVGALLLALVYWGGRPGRLLKRPEWRVAVGFASIALFTAAAFVGMRGGWVEALMLVLAGLAMAVSSRWPRVAPRKPPGGGAMSLQEARAVLGVGPSASREEVQAAYSRLMRVVHPDRGGAVGLAVQLNLARERLLKEPR